MPHAKYLRSASCAALILASLAARAQEALPTIDIGSEPSAVGMARGNRGQKTAAEGYVVPDATTASRTDVPIRETPAAIVVVPEQVMRDQQQTQLKDALENVSGVRSNNNELEGYNFKIRGFQSLVLFRNGLALGDASASSFDTANIERIEVLKGPASVLYGRMEPGGLVNFVTKRPLDREQYRIEQQIGSYDHYRTQWDLTAPIEEIPGLAYRFSGAYQNNRSFRTFQRGERLLVAPVVSYRPSAWTEFTLDTQFMESRAQSDAGSAHVRARLAAPFPGPARALVSGAQRPA